MEIDKTTYDDLSVFANGDDFSILQKFDFTNTLGGRHWLRHCFHNPFGNLKQIRETQRIIGLFIQHEKDWPSSITNGTVMVMERFYETALDKIPGSDDWLSALSYQVLHSPDFSLTRYSITHFADFFRGMDQLIRLFNQDDCPPMLQTCLQRARMLMQADAISSLCQRDKQIKFSAREVVYYGNHIRNRFKNAALELIDIYGRLDAWFSMAKASKAYQLAIPEFIEQDKPYFSAAGFYHLLLPDPVAYSMTFDGETNFLFLTGANMAGKSTFIKAVGITVYLAHLGLGVPAVSMRLSLFDGILSNINVVDNIARGESYFFNEVQRIRNTIIKINDKKKWLVLIDELFKGTNVQDAMKCSSAVIQGLVKIRSSIFILSTHLYEIGEELKQYPNIIFKYFETAVRGDQLEFSYQLQDGISNDRLGYLILKREGVVEMLENL